MYHHIVVQDALTHPFDSSLVDVYVSSLTSLWNVTCPMARLHLLSPPLPCSRPSPTCPVADLGWEKSHFTYDDVLDKWTRPWFEKAETGMKAAMGANYSQRVDVIPVGDAFVVEEDEDGEEEDYGMGVMQWYAEEDSEEGDAEGVLSLKGSYLVACLIFASTTGRSPVGAAVLPLLLDGGLNEEDVAAIQQRAADTLNWWWESTDKQLTALDGSDSTDSTEDPSPLSPPTVKPTTNVTANATVNATTPAAVGSSVEGQDHSVTPGEATYDSHLHKEQMEDQQSAIEWNESHKEELEKERTRKAKEKEAKEAKDREERDRLAREAQNYNEPLERVVEDDPTPNGQQSVTETPNKMPEEDESEVSGQQALTERMQGLAVMALVYVMIGVMVVVGLWWLWTCVRAQWTQKQLRKRRGYDDGEVGDFPKESTAGYAFDDGL